MTRYSLAKEIQKLKPGQRIEIGQFMLDDIVPIPGWTIEDSVMENIVGSSYEFRYWITERGGTVFERLSEPLTDGRRTYVSPDRRYRFRSDGHGCFVLIDEESHEN